MKTFFIFLAFFLATSVVAQATKKEVVTLGTFHFAFHNRDIKKTDKVDQIDVLNEKYQKEIIEIVEKLSKFKPTIIAVEVDPSLQLKVNSLYNSYLIDKHELNREEYQQIGFRLAKKLNLKKVYCVNDWGQNYEYVDSILEKDSEQANKFMSYFYKNPDSLLTYFSKDVFRTKGIKAQLKILNSEIELNKSLGNYFTGIFKYQFDESDFFGVDFTTGWWFNRNLRIFRNIQKIKTKDTDKILVIYGAGHMNLLNIFFRSSPEYELISVLKYLK